MLGASRVEVVRFDRQLRRALTMIPRLKCKRGADNAMHPVTRTPVFSEFLRPLAHASSMNRSHVIPGQTASSGLARTNGFTPDRHDLFFRSETLANRIAVRFPAQAPRARKTRGSFDEPYGAERNRKFCDETFSKYQELQTKPRNTDDRDRASPKRTRSENNLLKIRQRAPLDASCGPRVSRKTGQTKTSSWSFLHPDPSRLA